MEVDAEALIGSVIRGALGGRGKRARGAARYLTGGKGSFLNASTLLALAGVAWGLYETVTSQQASGRTPGPASTTPPSPGPPASTPPLPVVPAGPVGAPSSGAAAAAPGVIGIIRLTISAARADGTLSASEREAILTQARAVGAEAMVAAEIDTPRPLSEIVAGLADPGAREDAYVLAFSIIRADESVSGGERVYLAQLAHLLGLSTDDVKRLEQTAASRIDAEGTTVNG